MESYLRRPHPDDMGSSDRESSFLAAEQLQDSTVDAFRSALDQHAVAPTDTLDSGTHYSLFAAPSEHIDNLSMGFYRTDPSESMDESTGKLYRGSIFLIQHHELGEEMLSYDLFDTPDGPVIGRTVVSYDPNEAMVAWSDDAPDSYSAVEGIDTVGISDGEIAGITDMANGLADNSMDGPGPGSPIAGMGIDGSMGGEGGFGDGTGGGGEGGSGGDGGGAGSGGGE